MVHTIVKWSTPGRHHVPSSYNLSKVLVSEFALRHPLDDRGVGCAASLTNREETISALPLLQLMDQSCHELAPCAPQGVAQCHRATIDIDFVEAASGESFRDSKGHRSEGFVDLEEIDVLRTEARTAQGLSCGRHRALQHDHGVGTHNSQRYDLGLGPETQLAEALLVAHQDCRRAVANLRGRGWGDNPVLKHRLQLGDTVVGCLPQALILNMHLVRTLAFQQPHLQRNNLVPESSTLRGFHAPFLAKVCKFVELLLGHVIFFGKKLCASELAEVPGIKSKLLQLLHRFTIRLKNTFAVGQPMPSLHAVNDASTDRHLRHVLNTSGDHTILCATHHCLTGKVEGLLSRATLPVDARPGHSLRQALGAENNSATYVASLGTDLAHAPDDHIINVLPIEANLVDQSVNNSSAKVRRVPTAESAVSLPARTADGLHNVRCKRLELLACHRSKRLSR
mmetsp:Transcript_95088/g.246187  ORF Transcript_95088/g.246187 Transcript_95088/m.246187 type:complete len:453 (+) Transcript_95088:229-1587(+)